ncbi:MAG: PHP domain-containing protein, partial [Comamonas sp.]|nr:PHP domain-containing protein [Comamonas sp.]
MFVHLRLHTEFSVIDGTCRINDAISAAAADGQPALAITDLNNLFGALKFYKAGRGKGVKPILGAELNMEGFATGTPCRVLVLVQSQQGYHNLSEILARGWTGNVSKVQAQPFFKWEWLQELNEGLLLLSGANAGPVGQLLLRGDTQGAADVALQLASTFPHRFYLELQRAGRSEDEKLVVQTAQLAARLNLPVVATHPIQFSKPSDFESHETRVCIAEGEILGNAKRVRRFTREQYFKSSADMEQLFADIPSAIENTLEIARRCSVTLKLGTYFLPDFPAPGGMTMAD